jgi:zinc protease
LETGKNYLIGSYALQFDSGEKIAGQMNFAQIEGRPMSYFKTRNDRIRAVTLDQSLAAAEKLFSNNLRTVSVGGTSIALAK